MQLREAKYVPRSVDHLRFFFRHNGIRRRTYFVLFKDFPNGVTEGTLKLLAGCEWPCPICRWCALTNLISTDSRRDHLPLTAIVKEKAERMSGRSGSDRRCARDGCR